MAAEAEKQEQESISPVKIVAIFLPQFHRIPENDRWWGKGFTEWIQVTKAKPQFKGHYQPHLPTELGFYDILLPEIKEEQSCLARRYGIDGFCYYHYWFNGRQLLEKPVNQIFKSGKPDFPFCFCWANENWTKRWDGSAHEILIRQNYSHEDDLNHIQHLIPFFKDRRYITIEGKPIFFVYRIELLPDPQKTAEIWREEVKKAGLPGIYLGIFENFKTGIDPESFGFDAAVEFTPNIECFTEHMFNDSRYDEMFQNGEIEIGYLQNKVYSYRSVVERIIAKPDPHYKRFRGAFPAWDNSPRRSSIKGSTIVHGSTPEKFEVFVEMMIYDTYRLHKGEERLLFINAWNEWAEGCHLEPDRRFGLGYLEAIKQALLNTDYIPQLEMKDEHWDKKNYLETKTEKLKKLEERIHHVLHKESKPFDDTEDNIYAAQVFFDSGKGFNEDESIRSDINGEEKRLEFDLRPLKNIRQFRFDPIANYRVVVRIDETKIEDKDGKEHRLSILGSNAFYRKNNFFIFKTLDSQIFYQHQMIPEPFKIFIRFEYIAVGIEVDFYIKGYEKRKAMEKRLKRSIDYRIGRVITWPIRVLSKLKKKIQTVVISRKWRK
jgi:hypothetical protein